MSNKTWTIEQLKPFGLRVQSAIRGTDLGSIPVSLLKDWVNRHRLVILRGFAPLEGDALPQFCQEIGELLTWNFGAVNNLCVQAEARNYLYTNRAVPFHWDGAFIGRVPHYIFFHCDAAPPEGCGGETLFCDTTRLLARVSPDKQRLWKRIEITYATEKIAHYGGSFSSPLIARHPISGEDVLRFAEPVNDLNPVRLEIKGVPEEFQKDFLEDMHRRLNDEGVCYSHAWLNGDVVMADNHTLLHGRNAFNQNAERHIRRVNIL